VSGSSVPEEVREVLHRTLVDLLFGVSNLSHPRKRRLRVTRRVVTSQIATIEAIACFLGRDLDVADDELGCDLLGDDWGHVIAKVRANIQRLDDSQKRPKP
jgi:hypothetical protein